MLKSSYLKSIVRVLQLIFLQVLWIINVSFHNHSLLTLPLPRHCQTNCFFLLVSMSSKFTQFELSKSSLPKSIRSTFEEFAKQSISEIHFLCNRSMGNQQLALRLTAPPAYSSPFFHYSDCYLVPWLCEEQSSLVFMSKSSLLMLLLGLINSRSKVFTDLHFYPSPCQTSFLDEEYNMYSCIFFQDAYWYSLYTDRRLISLSSLPLPSSLITTWTCST